jgi:hypothetical protein
MGWRKNGIPMNVLILRERKKGRENNSQLQFNLELHSPSDSDSE